MMTKMIMNKAELEKFKRQVRDYFDYLRGFGYLRYSRKKRKYRIAISKRTWWIRRSRKLKMEREARKKNG